MKKIGWFWIAMLFLGAFNLAHCIQGWDFCGINAPWSIVIASFIEIIFALNFYKAVADKRKEM